MCVSSQSRNRKIEGLKTDPWGTPTFTVGDMRTNQQRRLKGSRTKKCVLEDKRRKHL